MLQFNFQWYFNFRTNTYFQSQNAEDSRFHRCLLAVFQSFSLQVNALKTQARKLANTLTHRSTDGDILGGKAKHRFQFVMLWKGKRKHRSYQRLSALAKLLNDNQLFDTLTLIACNGVSNACDKERTSRWFIAHSHARATSFQCMWIALRAMCLFWCRCFFNVTINSALQKSIEVCVTSTPRITSVIDFLKLLWQHCYLQPKISFTSDFVLFTNPSFAANANSRADLCGDICFAS